MGQQQEQQPDEQKVLQFMIAEHSALQTARSATIFESNGRVTLYLSTLSSLIVALAFIGQMSEMGDAFFIFTLILLPTLLFIGIVTFDRVLQVGIEDTIYGRGINRIRHYYTEIAPHMERYFILSTHDDSQAVITSMGVQPSRWQLFLTSAGMVGVINSIVAGVTAGVLALVFANAAPLVCIVCGILVFVISVILHTRYQIVRWNRAESTLKVLFSSPKPE